MAETAKLVIGEKTLELPIIVGTEDEKAIDIRTLRNQTGYITLDAGLMNTGSCESEITFINGEEGILRYRGIPLEQLAEKSSFVETSYLLLHGSLPTKTQLNSFSNLLREFSLIHEDMRHFFNHFPPGAHPMSTLGTMVNALSSFYPHVDAMSIQEEINITAARLISKVRTIAAFAYKKSIGEPFVYPSHKLSYCENFLNMMFSSPVNDFQLDPDIVKALDLLLILHADHEQNCSASSVRLVGSSHANLYAAITAGIAALWGPLHGGANQAVMEMLGKIHEDGGNIGKFIDMAKDKENNFRLSGFGHRVYKNYDPRARIIKDICQKILSKYSADDPLLEIAIKLEEKVLQDDYFIQRKLYPNVDFYSGLLYKAMGVPTAMFTVMFAIGRMPGWIAQWKEMISTPGNKIGRPRQVYTGKTETNYTPIDKR